MSGPTWRTKMSVAMVVAAVAALVLLPGAAHATSGDLLPAGTVYKASTYAGHSNYFGTTSMFNTVDIPVPYRTPIYAPEDGRVVQTSASAGGNYGWGNALVWTSADGTEQIHVAHLDEVATTGRVRAGDLIGYAGSSGNCVPASFVHLHIERAVNGAVAPVLLSGVQIIPGRLPNYGYYISKGPVTAPVAPSGPELLAAGDFDGDGTADVAALYQRSDGTTGVWVFRSTGTSFTRQLWWLSDAAEHTRVRNRLIAGDFDGDGLDDLVALADDGETTTAVAGLRSTGSGFVPDAGLAPDTDSQAWGRSRLVTGDFDGDGADDVAALYHYGNESVGLWVFRATESGFERAQWWLSEAEGE